MSGPRDFPVAIPDSTTSSAQWPNCVENDDNGASEEETGSDSLRQKTSPQI